MEVNIQRAILATFLWSNDIGTDTKDSFFLNHHLFTGDRFLIASKINEQTAGDKFYGLLNLELENTSQVEWMAISEQTPLTFDVSKRYHDNMPDPRGMRI